MKETKNGSIFSRWLEAASVYRDRRMVLVLLLGFSSGLPLALTASTLTLWLAREGVDKASIGLFALVGTPYGFKFLWAPLVDRLGFPPFTRWLGRRRGWLMVSQLTLLAAILALGTADPAHQPVWTALLALAVSFLSATQDIVIDAYRVEILPPRLQGAGAGVIVLGYRVGMLTSGAGALYVAHGAGWFAAYALMAALMGVGLLATLLFAEPPPPAGEGLASSAPSAAAPSAAGGWSWRRLRHWLRGAVVDPFADFLRRPGWFTILAFILLYKFGDALAGVMINPFYVEMGFSEMDIANASKSFGMAATIAGGLLGGVVVSRLGVMPSLLVCGVLQLLSNGMFTLLALAGHSLPLLFLAVGVENLTGGLGTAAFVAYLSSLCHVAYTATQYALLSSFMAAGRTLLASSGGWLALQVSWPLFFLLTAAAALPGLLLWFRLPNAESPPESASFSPAASI
ncbi:MAG: AmpG family muropeptide MFS transporter [Magnetococcales bacterium]|nr:AmpG family muropeptide MFS transporter [Magnetococcales bacterium]